MSRKKPPALPKWPFILGDLLLIGLAVFVILQAGGALNTWQIAFCVMGVVIGALLLVAPFVVEFYLVQKLHEEAEAEAIETILNRINTAVGEIMELGREQKEDGRKLEHTLAAYEGLSTILEKKAKAMQAAEGSYEPLLSQGKDLVKKVQTIEEVLAAMQKQWKSDMEEALQSRTQPDPLPEIAALIRKLEDRIDGVAAQIRERPGEGVVKSEGETRGRGERETDGEGETVAEGEKERDAETDAETEDSRATVHANILVGIGNKIYVRGEGEGLSWEEGVPMEFVEIGLYQWESPPLSEAIEVQLYLNDEISAVGEPVRIEPGAVVEVTPDFPG